MTSPELLKRNLKILKMYDSGDYGRKQIAVKLNLSSVWVVHCVIFNRSLYENDIRAPRLFPQKKNVTTKNLQNPTIDITPKHL